MEFDSTLNKMGNYSSFLSMWVTGYDFHFQSIFFFFGYY